jgi:hypothetical protein
MKESEIPPKSVFEVVSDLEPVDPAAVQEFLQAMNEDVIPKVVKVMDDRRLEAAIARQLQLKT